ncbi:redoxin domain-containing protein [Sphingomonas sp.]|uniref:redoxin domain-containing protein n=1 Tax=Sphingomonas sp. TaxID=28214 RepID=UPI0028AE89E8|nr:redoxin domain-containing protein [Sphingomonas sp.]
MPMPISAAPEWQIDRWLNTETPLSLSALRGKVVLAGAFQMLCPGCVSTLIPQLIEVHRTFPAQDLAVIGLHAVFEHHEAMGPAALAAFVHEYRIPFPIAIDHPGPRGDPMPRTMRRYRMQGTPTLLLIDRAGRLRRQMFGHVPDLQLGALLASLLEEQTGPIVDAPVHDAPSASAGGTCTDAACTPR